MSDLTLITTSDTGDQAMLREVVRDALADRSTTADVRRHSEGEPGYDPALWRLAGELGWFGLEAPGALGGTEQTFTETAIVLEELGRRVTPGPFLSHLVATGFLLGLGGELADAWGERLVNGEAIACAIPHAPHAEFEVKASRRDSGLVLDGDVAFALDVAHADLVLLPIALDGEAALVAVEPAASGIQTSNHAIVDRTRRVGTLSSDGAEVPATVLATGEQARRLLGSVWARGATAAAIDALGCAQEVLRMTVEYTSEREQFGRPVGTFQAVKHGCADMLVGVETARAAVRAAVRTVADDSQLSVARAKAHACDACDAVVGRGLQLHGGIGFTWEFDLHLWIKRAKLDSALFGSPSEHRAEAARALFAVAG